MTRLLALIGTVVLAAVLIVFSTTPGQQAQESRSGSRGAQQEQLAPGVVLSADQVHFIERPGRYGLGSQVPGSRYAIAGRHLVRIDPNTMQVLSVLRRQDKARD